MSPTRDPACWVACAEAVQSEAATFAELVDAFGYRERGETLCPPLLVPPPLGVPQDLVDELLADIDAAFAGVVAFAPHLISLAA